MGVSRYEDLQVWQRARALSNQIYEQTRGWPLAADRDLCQQLRTASISIVANIAEGFLRRRDKEFIQFLRIAQASNGEVRALLYMAGDRTYLPPDVTKR